MIARFVFISTFLCFSHFHLIAQEKGESAEEFDPFSDNAEEALKKLLPPGEREAELNFLEPGKVAELTRKVMPLCGDCSAKGERRR